MTTGVLRHTLPFTRDPERAFLSLDSGAPVALWLDEHGDRGRGVSYLAFPEDMELGDPFGDSVRALQSAHSLASNVSAEGAPLGVFLVLPYEAGSAWGRRGAEGGALPKALWVDRVVEIDHASHTIALLALGDSWAGELEQWKASTEQALSQGSKVPSPIPGDIGRLVWRDSPETYRTMIEGAHRAIREGDAYQLCVTTQLGLEGTVDPVALHRVMRSVSPTHHQALIRLGEITLVSASPETFLDISPQGKVVTKPIKGTRPRGATREEDVRLAEELVSSEKERAENLMIVDLMRNDLSKVCEVGSIHVPELCVLETYSSVHQLVSTVTGQLAPGADLWDVIEASFPAGSMTGAPKIRAMEVLAKMESGPRGYYSGIYGVWRVDGSATLGMTIRTAIVSRNSLSLGVGGGITALSDPDDEIREVGIKAAAFLQALGVSQGDYS